MVVGSAEAIEADAIVLADKGQDMNQLALQEMLAKQSVQGTMYMAHT